MSSRFRTYSLVTMLAVGLFGLQAAAQNATTGAISGTVTDPSNAVIGNAAVTLTNIETGTSASTLSTSTGAYGFPLLGPGRYKVTVKQTGFRTTEQTATVAVGQTTTVNIQLLVGQGTEIVEVTGAIPLIQ